MKALLLLLLFVYGCDYDMSTEESAAYVATRCTASAITEKQIESCMHTNDGALSCGTTCCVKELTELRCTKRIHCVRARHTFLRMKVFCMEWSK